MTGGRPASAEVRPEAAAQAAAGRCARAPRAHPLYRWDCQVVWQPSSRAPHNAITAADGGDPERPSIASAAVPYNAAVVSGIAMPVRSSAIDATIESISALAVTRCCVSASIGTFSFR
eukprot:2277212-Prymnesium_polylepis.2